MSTHQALLRTALRYLSALDFGHAILAMVFLAGLGIVPFAIWFRLVPGMTVKTLFLRLFYTAGALTLPGIGTALDRRTTGRWELNPVRKTPAASPHDTPYEIKRDGTWQPLDGNPDRWSRLGKRRFTMTYEKSPEVFAGISEDYTLEDFESAAGEEETATPTVPDSVGADAFTPDAPAGNGDDVAADGGLVDIHGDGVYLSHVQGNEAICVDTRELRKDGYTVNLSKVDAQLESGGEPQIILRAGEKALEDHGGDTSGMSNLALVLATFLSTIFGAVFAVVLFG